MEIIPAIDLKEGCCVRLQQGEMQRATVFSSDPVTMASHWHSQGAKRLHIVDLDGAFAGEPKHLSIISDICRHNPDLLIQVGGGIRNNTTVKTYLDVGVKAVVIGTQAVQLADWVIKLCSDYKNSVIIGLDARGMAVATEGWTGTTQKDLWSLVDFYSQQAINAIVYTDIERDGMMGGPNIEQTRALVARGKTPIIASGGVSSLEDIRILASIPQLYGVIVGRALYDSAFNLGDAIKLASH